MAGKDVRKLVMAIAIIVLRAFRRVFEELRRLPEEICRAPTVMQGFKLEILVFKFSAERRQLLTQDLNLVEPPVPRCIDVQSPGRLEQLRPRIHLFGERFCLL
jgi:hypothetical protein